jgi:hypothetical protein
LKTIDPNFRGGHFQEAFFDADLTYRECRRCGRHLHPDPQRRYQTGRIGLYYRCRAAYDRADGWSIEDFARTR